MQQAASRSLQAGDEPIPGYRLLEPLGEGGFGVVWKCRAPGGLNKAIKFVRSGHDGASPATQELEALERVKELRHPFMLSLERVEVQADGTALIVTELADESLHSLYESARAQGMPGVPRDELLGYLSEAAEALDWMNEGHGLQHLDVKPHNLFLVSGHVKVADFGLVHHLGAGDGEHVRKGGLTPLYSAPETLRGTFSRHSDQYSLAVVYQQLLTGTVPFWHSNVNELMMQHLTATPDLEALGDGDRQAVARALAKVPEHRFASCQAFISAIRGGPTPQLRRSGAWRRVIVGAGIAAAPSNQPTQIEPPSTLPSGPAAPAAGAGDEDPTRRIRAVAPVAPSRLPGSGPQARVRLEPGDPLAPPSELTEVVVTPPEEGPAPTAICLPSYRFLACVSQGPLGDVWKAEDAEGRGKRAVAMLGFVRYDARLIAHLQALRDPALPATEVHWSPAERLVVLTDEYEGAIRDRFEQRQAEGHPGVPRAELLGLLRWAAVALDGLHARHGLQHLGLNPRNLLVQGDRLWVAEFGLVPLLWLPTGQSAAAINARYAAPELFDGRPSRSADQYSLALVYAEMLTGIHPRPSRSSSGGVGVGGMARNSGAYYRAVRLDLGLVPSHDREVLLQALSSDPASRFASCTALVEALEQAGAERPPPEDLYDTLPAVIPYASLLGEPAGPDAVMPTVPQLVKALAAPTEPRPEAGRENGRYFVLPDGTWEQRYPVDQTFPGALALKVEGLRAHWGAWLTSPAGGAYRLVMDLEVPRGFWERYTKKPRRLEVTIEVGGAEGAGARRSEAVVRLRYQGADGQGAQALSVLGPRVFDSAREYLQAAPEQRARDRVPLAQPVRVYPVLPDLELGEVLEGECRDISAGGIRFWVPRRPEADVLYLHLYAAAPTLGYAVHARVTRVAEAGGGVEIGARFLAE